MSRQNIAELGENDHVDEIYLASGKQLRPNRQGNLYLQLQLADKSGSANAMMWNATEKTYKLFEDGDYLKIKGKSQFYNGAMQIIVNQIDKVDASSIDESDFHQLAGEEIEGLKKELTDQLRAINNVHLRNLADCFLIDEDFMDKFSRAPAGVKNHHAFQGGLLSHVVNLVKTCKAVAPLYKELDEDLLVMGAFVHDLGKIDELTYDKGFAYSDEGQLIGHLVMGVNIVEEKVKEAEKLSGDKIPAELVLRLKHMVVSHHGKLEFGSPKVPMTLEAVALNYLDSMDAHLASYAQLIEEDVNTDSNWTTYFPAIGRKFYKGEQS
ncbi:MAG: 3'-5' exoribonuclease YhaM family protein [Pirellulales bacterium]